MENISKDTATEIAMSYREIETAKELLGVIEKALRDREAPDLHDVFGRRQNGLQLGVPTGHNSHRLFDVPYALAVPIIKSHIAHHEAVIALLSERFLSAAFMAAK